MLRKGLVQVKVASPNAPKEDDGYDLKIGASERGDVTVDNVNPPFKTPHYKHSLIVIGGVARIELFNLLTKWNGTMPSIQIKKN